MAPVRITMVAVQQEAVMEWEGMSPATVTMPATSLVTAALTLRVVAATVTAPVSINCYYGYGLGKGGA